MSWEGGWRAAYTPLFNQPFRNQYTRVFGKRLIKNWSDLNLGSDGNG